MSSRQLHILYSKVFRTGKQSLLADCGGRFYVRLENRTNDTTIEIPPDKVDAWRRRLQ